MTRRMVPVLLAVALLIVLLAGQTPSAMIASSIDPAKAGPGLAAPMTAPLFGIATTGEFHLVNPQLAPQAGVRWARHSVQWSEVEPQQGVFDFAKVDGEFASFQQLGLIPLPYVAGNPAWASTSHCGPIDLVPFSVFGTFIGTLAERYDGDGDYNGDGIVDGAAKPRVDYWALYNEPDNQWTSGPFSTYGGCWGKAGAQYAQLLKVAWDAIHAANVDAQLVFGGIAAEPVCTDPALSPCPQNLLYQNFNISGGDFVDDVLNEMARVPGHTYFDIFDFHYYQAFDEYGWWAPWGPGIIGKGQYYVNRLAQSRLGQPGITRPFMCTEAGTRSDAAKLYYGIPSSDEEQSRGVVRNFVRSMRLGLRAMTWYTWMDDYTGGQAWGFLRRPDYATKPSYTALQTLTQQVGTASAIPDIYTQAGVEGYVFTLPNIGYRTVLWSTVMSATVNVTFLGNDVYTTDKWGVPTAYHGTTGQISVPITNSPIYIDGRPGVVPTITPTPTITATPTRTATPTATPTNTPIPPVADFTSSTTIGGGPLLVQFTDLSTGPITSRLWSFGDSGTATATNPAHTYVSTGCYTVSLSVTGPGGSDDMIRKAYIDVVPARGYTFDDVPPTHPQWQYIEKVFCLGITTGTTVNPPMFAPDASLTRAQIATFIDRALGWPPQNPVLGLFTDMAPTFWGTPWAETFYLHNVTTGCTASPLAYCPSLLLTKAQIATLIARANGWPAVNPPAHIFQDMIGHWAEGSVEAFYAHSPGTQCSTTPLLFCPGMLVNRAYMAELLVKGFGL